MGTEQPVVDPAAPSAFDSQLLRGLLKRLNDLAAGGGAATVSVTRPANTTSYTAGDVIGVDNAGSAGSAVLTFAGIGPANGGEILITSTDHLVGKSSVPSGMTSFRLHLYGSSPPSALLDNAPWDLPSGDRAAYLGYVDLGTPVDVGSTLYVRGEQAQAQFTVPSGGALYGYLVTNGGYQPASNDVHRVGLHSAHLSAAAA